MEFTFIASFFALGLLGGFGHCAGMCNPFVLYITSSFQKTGEVKRFRMFLPHIAYNFGRIITYISLGVLCAILGKISDNLLNIQGVAAICAGVFLLIYGSLGFLGVSSQKIFESGTLISILLKSIRTVQPRNPFFVGIVLGFLPCGLVYSALVGSVALNSPLASGIAMACFGVGTSVAMLMVACFSNVFIQKRGILYKASMLFLIVMGIYFIINGFV